MCMCVHREKREKERGGGKGVGEDRNGKDNNKYHFCFVCLVNTVLNRLPLEALVRHLSTNTN